MISTDPKNNSKKQSYVSFFLMKIKLGLGKDWGKNGVLFSVKKKYLLF